MLVKDILRLPPGEVAFIFPINAPEDTIDKQNYPRLQVDRRGLRKWTSFQEWPPALQRFMDLPVDFLEPRIRKPARIAYSEDLVSKLLFKTVLYRVESALGAVSPNLGIGIAAKKWNTESPPTEKSHNIMVWEQEDANPATLDQNMIVFGDIKLKQPSRHDGQYLPGTECYEEWLAEPVQGCLDRDIPFGFQLTNQELVLFQLVRMEDVPSATRVTRTNAPEDTSLPMNHREGDYSSPVDRSIPSSSSPLSSSLDPSLLLNLSLNPSSPRPSTPQRVNSNQPLLSSPLSSLNSSPSTPSCTRPSLQGDNRNSGQTEGGCRSPDASHILIKSYKFDDAEAGAEVGIRLFEFIMLARQVKDQGLRIGPNHYAW